MITIHAWRLRVYATACHECLIEAADLPHFSKLAFAAFSKVAIDTIRAKPRRHFVFNPYDHTSESIVIIPSLRQLHKRKNHMEKHPQNEQLRYEITEFTIINFAALLVDSLDRELYSQWVEYLRADGLRKDAKASFPGYQCTDEEGDSKMPKLSACHHDIKIAESMPPITMDASSNSLPRILIALQWCLANAPSFSGISWKFPTCTSPLRFKADKPEHKPRRESITQIFTYCLLQALSVVSWP